MSLFNVFVNRDEIDQRIVKFIARKADLLFCHPDTLFKSQNEDSHRRTSMLPFYYYAFMRDRIF